MNKKLTNVSALEMVLAMEEVKSNQELVEKLTKMKEQFEKKNNSSTGSKRLTKTQIENEEIKAQIRSYDKRTKSNKRTSSRK